MSLLPSQVWLLIGIALCVVELLVPLPTFLIAGAMGIAALLVAAISLLLPIPALQVLAWMLISAMLAVVSRRFIPKDSHQLKRLVRGLRSRKYPQEKLDESSMRVVHGKQDVIIRKLRSLPIKR